VGQRPNLKSRDPFPCYLLRYSTPIVSGIILSIFLKKITSIYLKLDTCLFASCVFYLFGKWRI
jgi:hypothetical protein